MPTHVLCTNRLYISWKLWGCLWWFPDTLFWPMWFQLPQSTVNSVHQFTMYIVRTCIYTMYVLLYVPCLFKCLWVLPHWKLWKLHTNVIFSPLLILLLQYCRCVSGQLVSVGEFCVCMYIHVESCTYICAMSKPLSLSQRSPWDRESRYISFCGGKGKLWYGVNRGKRGLWFCVAKHVIKREQKLSHFQLWLFYSSWSGIQLLHSYKYTVWHYCS